MHFLVCGLRHIALSLLFQTTPASSGGFSSSELQPEGVSPLLTLGFWQFACSSQNCSLDFYLSRRESHKFIIPPVLTSHKGLYFMNHNQGRPWPHTVSQETQCFCFKLTKPSLRLCAGFVIYLLRSQANPFLSTF